MCSPLSPPELAYVALGGNVGDVLATFRRALKNLAGRGVEISALSPAYRTQALTLAGASPEAAQDYWNATCAVRTALSAPELLDVLLAVERDAGRQRDGLRWGPRCLDLDLLLYGLQQHSTPALTLPHPHLHERLFVLRPLCDIAPDATVPPAGLRVREHLQAHNDPSAGILAVQVAWFTE